MTLRPIAAVLLVVGCASETASPPGGASFAASAAAVAPGPASLLLDVHPGSGVPPADIGTWATFRGRTWFRAHTTTVGVGIWVTDGTQAGTSLKFDLRPYGTAFSGLSGLAACDDALFFTSGGALYRSDGTPEGTHLVVESVHPVSELVGAGTHVFWVAGDGGSKYTLFAASADGSLAGRLLPPDVVVPPSEPILASGDQLLFVAEALADSSKAVWISDGTPAGTAQTSAMALSELENAAFGGVALPPALVVWDGTRFVPRQVDRDGASSRPRWLGANAGHALFAASPPPPAGTLESASLFVTDGTAAGTAELVHGNGPSPLGLTLDERVVFGAIGGLFSATGTPGDVRAESNELRTTWSDPQGRVGPALIGTGVARVRGRFSVDWIPSLGTSAVPLHTTLATRTWLIAADGDLYYFSQDKTTDPWYLERTSTTPGTAARLMNLSAGSVAPAGLTRSGNRLFFAKGATQALQAWNLSTNTGGPVTSASGTIPANAGWLVDLNGKLVFSANGEPWTSDGTAAGTLQLADIGPGTATSDPSQTTAFGTLVFFFANDGVHGREPWVTDGTAAGTRLLRDIMHGELGSVVDVQRPVVIPGTGLLLFAADDGVHGTEPWVTDGTTAGTMLLQDLAPGPLPSNPFEFMLSADHVYFSADDGTHGNEPWSMAIADIRLPTATPPQVRCPADVTLEATGGTGAKYEYSLSGSDPANFTFTLSASPASGSTFPIGDDLVTGTVLNEAGIRSTCTFTIHVRDTTRPTVTCPAALTLEAAAGESAAADFRGVSATDLVGIDHVAFTPAAGTSLPLGTTHVVATAYDAAGNHASCAFDAEVKDTVAPVITCPAPLVLEATSAAGALLPADLVHATDGASQPTVTVGENGLIYLGFHVITATATDGAGNTASCRFEVRVVDTLAPAVTCPADRRVEAGGPGGTVVALEDATTSDAVGIVSHARSVASPHLFPLGRSEVVDTVRDAAGNESSCRYAVSVTDTRAPALSCPPDQFAEATGADGAIVTFQPTATDTVSTPTIAATPASGTRFALGDTTVDVRARDAAGNESVCHFGVRVLDGLAPTLRCPSEVHAEATAATGARVTYGIEASDAVSEASITKTPSGEWFPLGRTTVHVTARDHTGNAASCDFPVLVTDTTAPIAHCPTDMTIEATSAAGAVAAFELPAAEDAVSSPRVTAAPASGSTFPLGTTTVDVAATDEAANVGVCHFAVRVVDTVAPAVGCPPNLTVEATSPAGAAVPFAVDVSDAVGAAPAITSVAPGSTLPIGTSHVTATSADSSGNSGTCEFTVAVVDTTAPVLDCPGRVDAEAEDASGAAVRFALAGHDLVSPVQPVAEPASGTRFPFGTTPVVAIARDEAGNEASCTFEVRVRDTSSPDLRCPDALRLEATGPDGARAELDLAATDTVDDRVVVTTDPPGGTVLARGTTVVTATARDAAGNWSRCAVPVTVADTTPPTLRCPADVHARASGPDGADVAFAAPEASDAVTPDVPVHVSHASGSRFAPGRTTVRATAVDAAGNESACSFVVEVEHPVGVATGGCASAPAGLLGLAACLLARRRRR